MRRREDRDRLSRPSVRPTVRPRLPPSLQIYIGDPSPFLLFRVNGQSEMSGTLRPSLILRHAAMQYIFLNPNSSDLLQLSRVPPIVKRCDQNPPTHLCSGARIAKGWKCGNVSSSDQRSAPSNPSPPPDIPLSLSIRSSPPVRRSLHQRSSLFPLLLLLLPNPRKEKKKKWSVQWLERRSEQPFNAA